jgi:hypothetical protein
MLWNIWAPAMGIAAARPTWLWRPTTSHDVKHGSNSQATVSTANRKVDGAFWVNDKVAVKQSGRQFNIHALYVGCVPRSVN